MTNNAPNRQLKIILAAVILSLLSLKTNAAEISGVSFSENYLDEGINMSLQGMGLKTMLFFKAFAAGYYRGEGNDSSLEGDYPQRIEVEYFIHIPGAKLNSFTIEKMKDNVSAFELESLKDKIQQMGRYFVDLKPGDRFSLTYIPGLGTKFALNGQLVGIIKGHDFAKALFSVWIGKRPFDDRLKEQVLGFNR